MQFEDQEIIDEFVIESTEHLSDIEGQLLTIEAGGADIDVDLVNTVFRGVHSIKGAAGFLGLTTINKLAHSLENVLNLMRERKLVPTPAIVDVMLRSSDELRGLLLNVAESNDQIVDSFIKSLESIAAGLPETTAVNTAKVDNASASASRSTDAGGERTNAATATSKKKRPANKRRSSSNSTSKGKADAAEPSETRLATQVPVENVQRAQADDEIKPQAPAQLPVSDPVQSSNLSTTKSNTESNIRVSVESLDRLMNLAGELVLGRNQLLQSIDVGAKIGLEAVAAKINQVTCELQDAIMQTRMQPIGNVFTRFTRVVRDLSAKLGKQCDLKIEGKEVEVDKTIVEAIADPLTHLVRNAVDHGLESPEARVAKGKDAQGLLQLRAFHQSGKVCIEISDDGAGINVDVVKAKAVEKGLITHDQSVEMHDRDAFRLIFMPGFSTAATISDVSGRGVGMDVVRTNIEKLGGTVEIDSKLGLGTKIQVTLPLTLAIIPSLIVHCSDNRFAIPQVNIVELVRVRSGEAETRIGKLKDAEVLRLRGSLLPLVRLNDALSIQQAGAPSEDLDDSLNIVVVETGQQRYGMIVDGLFDSEEIVVKPLGRHLKECRFLSGATILGDGRVALILDVAGIAHHVKLGITSEQTRRESNTEALEANRGDTQSLLLFSTSPEEQFALPMGVVSRIERVQNTQLRRVGQQLLLQYPNSSLPLISLPDYIHCQPAEQQERMFVVVFEAFGKEVGLIAPILKDIRNVTAVVDDITLKEPAVIGSLVIDEQTTRMLDVHDLVTLVHPEWARQTKKETEEAIVRNRILLAEDSKFFRNQVKKHLEDHGYAITEAVDGQEAWDKLTESPKDFDIIVTDIQMPRMNGFELCELIKQNAETCNLPVIALTSLAGDDDMRRGLECGVDDYQVKMDREKLLQAVARLLRKESSPSTPVLSSLSSTVSAELSIPMLV
ncbi:MAG: chemotaxis protein CheW [Planctomycetales bacterium]|nr:chemotaxis protein CheW [Planctomycetales bacterium]